VPHPSLQSIGKKDIDLTDQKKKGKKRLAALYLVLIIVYKSETLSYYFLKNSYVKLVNCAVYLLM
jgi:hypothetical protein